MSSTGDPTTSTVGSSIDMMLPSNAAPSRRTVAFLLPGAEGATAGGGADGTTPSSHSLTPNLSGAIDESADDDGTSSPPPGAARRSRARNAVRHSLQMVAANADSSDDEVAHSQEEVLAFTRKARPEEEVAIESLVAYLEHSIRKTSGAVGFFPHLVLLIFVIIHVSIVVVDSRSPTRTAAIQNLLQTSQLTNVQTISDFNSYVNTAITGLIAQETARVQSAALGFAPDSLYIGMISLRVQRAAQRSANSSDCSTLATGLLTADDVLSAGLACASNSLGDYSSALPSVDPLPNILQQTATAAAAAGLTVVANTTLRSPNLYRGRTVDGSFRNGYPALPSNRVVVGWSVAQLGLPLPLGITGIDMSSGLNFTLNATTASSLELPLLQYAGLELTAAVNAVFANAPEEIVAAFFEVVLFSREASSVVPVTIIFERLIDVGNAIAMIRPFTMRQLTLNTSPLTSFGLFAHILGTLMVVAFLIESIFEAKLNLELTEHAVFRTRNIWAADADVDDARSAAQGTPWIMRAMSPWIAFDVGFAALYATYLGFYFVDASNDEGFKTVVQGANTADGSSLALRSFTDLMEMGDNSFNERRLYAVVLVFLFVRTFRYLAFSDRVSLINTTVYTAFHNVVSLLILAVIIMMAFTYGGVLLWSPDDPLNSFSSVQQSFGYMFQFILNGNADFSTYMVFDRASAVFFFGGYFFMVWVLLLNVVVGIMTLAFAALVEMSMMTERPSWSPAKLFKDTKKWVQRTSLGARLFPMSPNATYLSKRRELLALIRLWQSQGLDNYVSAPTNISLQRILQFTSNTIADDAFIRKVFAKAQQQLGEPSAVERRQRGLQRGVDRGKVMRERMREQRQLVEALYRRTVVQRGVAARLQALQAAGPEVTVMDYDVRAASGRVAIVTEAVGVDSSIVRRTDALLTKSARLIRGMCQELQSKTHILIVQPQQQTSPLLRAATSIVESENSASPTEGLQRSQSLVAASSRQSSSTTPSMNLGLNRTRSTMSNARQLRSVAAVATAAARQATSRSVFASRLKAMQTISAVAADPAIDALTRAEEDTRAALEPRLLALNDVLSHQCLSRVGVELTEALHLRDVLQWKTDDVDRINALMRARLEAQRAKAVGEIAARRAKLLAAAKAATAAAAGTAAEGNGDGSEEASGEGTRNGTSHSATGYSDAPEASHQPLHTHATPADTFATAVKTVMLLQRHRREVSARRAGAHSPAPRATAGPTTARGVSAAADPGLSEVASPTRKAIAKVAITPDGKVLFDTSQSVVPAVPLATLEQQRIQALRRSSSGSANRSRVFALKPGSSPINSRNM